MKAIKVIKIGGALIDNPKQLQLFLNDFSQLPHPKVLVHGGGNSASKLANQLGLPVKMIDGRRITSTKMLEVTTMVYAGKINTQLVAQLQSLNCNAIGLSGADLNTIEAKKRDEAPLNFGWVGDIVAVNLDALLPLIEQNISAVFCAITHDNTGQLLNTNADTIASELAIALSKFYHCELYYCFDKPGVLKNISDPSSTIESLTKNKYNALKESGSINTGMIPKLDNCFNAIEKNVAKVHLGLPDMISAMPKFKYTVIK